MAATSTSRIAVFPERDCPPVARDAWVRFAVRLGLALTLLRGPAALGQVCVGDCNGNGAVTIDELMQGVCIGLGLEPVDLCAAFDPVPDGRVRINELVLGVGDALGGCGGEVTPETLILDMAKASLSSVVGHATQSLLFPSSSIDYQTLMTDFLNAVQLELDQQTITEQEGDVNGEMANLFDSNTLFQATCPSDTTGINDVYNAVIVEEAPVNMTLGVLEQYPQQSLAGWMSGAQVKLSFLALEIQLNAILDPTNRAVQTELATNFQQFITYAGETRNSVLYANIQKVVEKVNSCSTENCNCLTTPSGTICDTCWHYEDCDGHEHTWDESSSTDCNKSRSASIESCAANTYNTQSQDLAWMDSVLNTWRDSLAGMADQIADMSKPCAICQDAQSFITVDQATISITGDLPEGTTQDATEWFQAACNGLQTCDYKLAQKDFAEPGPFTLVEVSYVCGSDPTEHTVSFSGAGNPQLSEGAYIHLDCAQRIASMQASFRGQPLQSGSDADVSTHSQHVPDAAKLNDEVAPEAGSAYNDPEAIVLPPYTGPGSALTIDLQSVVQLCGGANSSGECEGYDAPEIDADNNDVYHLDYSTDGLSWTSWVDFPTVSNGGLQDRSAPDTPDVTGRFVRVYPTSGDGKYSVAELIFASPTFGPIYRYKPAWGPEPLITNGVYAPAGTGYNDAQYATELAGTGPADALHIDLGKAYYLSHVKVQADNNDIYQLDVSDDDTNWVSWYTVPTVSSGGLQTRDSGTLPATLGRYLRVYAESGDGKYSVSEVQVFANATVPVCNGLADCAFSVAELIYAQTGAAPTAQDLEDFTATWTCESAPGPPPTNPTPQTTPTPCDGDTAPTPASTPTQTSIPTPQTAHAEPWNGDAVVSVTCLPSAVTCNTSQVTTCSVFAPVVTENGNSAAQQRPDDVVYENVLTFPYQICVSSQYPQCTQVIAGKTNYYNNSSDSPSTHDDPACLNVQRAIHDAIAGGSCPAGVAANANTSENVWPYNLSIAGGQSSGCLPYPGTQPALLPFIGCGPYVQ